MPAGAACGEATFPNGVATFIDAYRAARSGLRASLGQTKYPRASDAVNQRPRSVQLVDPGDVEEAIIRQLLPPLNDKHATGSPYRVAMRALRKAMRSASQ